MLKDGVFLVVVAAAWFSGAMMLVKAIGPDVPVEWVVFMRNAAAVPLLAAVMWRRGTAFQSGRWTPLILRGCFGVLAMTCRFWALPRMPLANAMLLMSTNPLFAALWGVLFFDEKLDRVTKGCLAAAFMGVYMAFRPEMSFEALPYLAAIGAGFFSSIAFAASKSASRTEPALRILFYFGLIGTVMFFPQALESGYVPSGREWALLAGVGLLATGGQLFLTVGLERAPVSRASSGTLFIIVLNILGGWLFWAERPDLRTWAGCLLIGAGILGLTGSVRRRLPVSPAA